MQYVLYAATFSGYVSGFCVFVFFGLGLYGLRMFCQSVCTEVAVVVVVGECAQSALSVLSVGVVFGVVFRLVCSGADRIVS